jgi:hypothetical protein
MDNLDNKTPIQAGENDLQAQFDALRHLVTSTLILVIVVSGTFNIYLLRQWRTVSKELAQIRPQAAQIITDYQKSGPMMDDFVNRITEYGRTHADFAPIMAKYNLRPAGTASAPPATQASSPATMPKK